MVKVEGSLAFRRNGAKVPARGVNAHHFASRLECSRLGGIAFARGAAAQAQEPAVRGPIHVVGLIGFVLDAEAPRPHGWGVGVQVNGRHVDFMIARTPRDLFPVRAQGRTTTGDFQVDDIRPMRRDEQDPVVNTHAGVHGRHDPLAIRSETSVVEMVQIGAVRMWFDFARAQVVEAHPFRVVIEDVELWILLW